MVRFLWNNGVSERGKNVNTTVLNAWGKIFLWVSYGVELRHVENTSLTYRIIHKIIYV